MSNYTAPVGIFEINLDTILKAHENGFLVLDLGVDATDATGYLIASTGDVSAEFIGVLRDIVGSIGCQLDDCVGYVDAKYDSNVKRYVIASVTSDQRTGSLRFEQIALAQEQAVRRKADLTSTQEVADAVSISSDFTQHNGSPIDVEVGFLQEQAIRESTSAELRYENGTPLFQEVGTQQEVAIPESQGFSAPVQQLIPKDRTFTVKVNDTQDGVHVFKWDVNRQDQTAFQYTPATLFDVPGVPTPRVFTFSWEEYVPKDSSALHLSADLTSVLSFDLGYDKLETVTETKTIFDSVSTYTPQENFVYGFTAESRKVVDSVQRAGYRSSNFVGVKSAVTVSKKVCFKFEVGVVVFNERTYIEIKPPKPPDNGDGSGGGEAPPPNEVVSIIVPVRDVYFMKHILEVTLKDGTPLDVSAVKLNLDADSWSWRFGGTLLDVSQIPLVKNSNGEPVEIIVNINGEKFNLLVEDVNREQTFESDGVSMSGRGLTALLSQPYIQPKSEVITEVIDVNQLMTTVLPTGWNYTWETYNWNLPGNVFSYQGKTPIQVVSEIAGNIGAVIVPSKTKKEFTVRRRYPVLPWNFTAATANVTVPSSIITGVHHRNSVPSQANGVYVHGSDMSGVQALIKRIGSDGARLAPTANNPLMTDVYGCIALGERLLAGQHEQPSIQSFTAPFDNVDMPLMDIGHLIKISIDGGFVWGVVNSVAIEADLGSVSQTVTLGEETSNVWNTFKSMVPEEPLLVGEVLESNNNSAVLRLLDGGKIRARGQANVGDMKYVRGGLIESEAPTLTLYTQDI